MWVLEGLSLAQVEELVGSRSQPGDVDAFMEQYRAMAPHLRAIAVTLLLLGFLPGLAYLVLGFAVRSGRRWASVTAFVLTGTQALVLGLIFLLNLLGALLSGSAGAVAAAVMIWGALAGLLAYTAWTLLGVVRGRGAAVSPAPTWPGSVGGREPWDRW
jgi:hypothetical protein